MTDKQREMAEHSAKGHALTLTDRAHVEIGGVVEVCSFDEESVVLVTACGELTVEGAGLRVGALDLTRGVVVVDGRVSAFYYDDTNESHKKGSLRGLFRKV